MAPRRPPTVDEIAESLKTAPGILQGRAMLYRYAGSHLRQAFHTTSRRAMEWIAMATAAETHEFELIGTVSGRIVHVARGGETLTLHEAGYVQTEDQSYWPLLSYEGKPVSKDGDPGSHEYVVLSKDLQSMCDRASEFHASAIEARQRSEAVALEGAEARHGSSLALFRGLLKTAGIAVTPDVFSARYRASISGEYTALHLDLFDGNIDAVAAVLAAFGIEPDPPTQIVTRKSLQEASDA